MPGEHKYHGRNRNGQGHGKGLLTGTQTCGRCFIKLNGYVKCKKTIQDQCQNKQEILRPQSKYLIYVDDNTTAA